MHCRPVIIIAILICAGCAQPHPAGETNLTAEERALLDKITADHFVRIVEIERTASGVLLVTTRQGESRVRYLVSPGLSSPGITGIRRVQDQTALPVGVSASRGSGPEARGIR